MAPSTQLKFRGFPCRAAFGGERNPSSFALRARKFRAARETSNFSIIAPGFDLLFLAKTFGSLLAATLGLLLSKTSGFLLNVVNIDVSILSSHFLCTAAPAWWSNALATTTTRWLTWDNDYQEVCTLKFSA